MELVWDGVVFHAYVNGVVPPTKFPTETDPFEAVEQLAGLFVNTVAVNPVPAATVDVTAKVQPIASVTVHV